MFFFLFTIYIFFQIPHVFWFRAQRLKTRPYYLLIDLAVYLLSPSCNSGSVIVQMFTTYTIKQNRCLRLLFKKNVFLSIFLGTVIEIVILFFVDIPTRYKNSVTIFTFKIPPSPNIFLKFTQLRKLKAIKSTQHCILNNNVQTFL